MTRPTTAPTRPSDPVRETRRTRPASSTTPVEEIECVPWSVLGPQFIRQWGVPRGKLMPEHLEILGQSGSGKSYFEMHVLLDRARLRGSHIVVVATKPADQTLLDTGWPIIHSWPPSDPRETCHIYWVKAPGVGKAALDEQARQIYDLLAKLWHPDANIIVVIDEIAYLVVDLNTRDYPLKTVLTKYYREGRALGITMVASTQRPQGVPRQMHSEASWTVCFAPKDEEDAERMAQILGGKRTYMPLLQLLNREKYEFLIVHNLTGKKYISWIDTPLPAPVKRR